MPSNMIGLEGISTSTGYSINLTTNPELYVPFSVGTTAFGGDGSAWTFVKLAASQTVTAGDCLFLTDINGTWSATNMTSTNARGKLGALVGIAGATLTSGATSNEYMWMQIRGYASPTSCVTGSTANTALHSSATAGRTTSTAVGGTSVTITGIVALATAASNTAAVYLNFPAVGAND